MSDWTDLDALDAYLWARLARAAAESGDPWRRVALATAAPDGPQLRIVALRAADRETATVEMHTDARTPKVAQLKADARAQLLFWDEGRQEQLRLSLDVSLIAADPARWAAVPEVARVNYGTDPAPGTRLDRPDAFDRTPRLDRFVALVGRVRAMDAVSLSLTPHRRAQWRDGAWAWVAP